MNRPGDKFSPAEPVGYHRLPEADRLERDRNILNYFDTHKSTCRMLADRFDMSYEGMRAILRKYGRRRVK